VVAYDPIQGQGHGGPKVVEMVGFKVYLQRYACIHKTMILQDNILMFSGHIFDIHSCSVSRDLQS